VLPGAGPDDDVHALRRELLDDLGDERDMALTPGGLLRDSESHRQSGTLLVGRNRQCARPHGADPMRHLTVCQRANGNGRRASAVSAWAVTHTGVWTVVRL
jgi:hypothetical protein